MATTCKVDVSKTGMLFSPVKLTSGQSKYNVRASLLDTGATICHMTYTLWREMRLHEACWNNNPSICKLMGLSSAEDMTFNNLPLISGVSILGDGSHAKVYEFKLDSLEIGKPTLGFNHSIILDNITVRLINRKDSNFIVGWNVLKYLQPTYNPSPTQAIYNFTLTNEGLQLFQQDRNNKINNFMQSMFDYRQE